MKKIFLSVLALGVHSLPVLAQWVTQNSGTSSLLEKVFFSSTDTGYVLKENGSILKTTNGGNNWAPVSASGTAACIYFTSNDTGYAGLGNDIKKTTDGGVSWLTKYTAAPFYFQDIFFPAENIGYAIGIDVIQDIYNIYKTIDSGENWSLQGNISEPGVDAFPSLFFTSIDTGYFSGIDHIYKTNDGGQSWAFYDVDTIGVNTEINSLYFPSANVGYAVGGSGSKVYKTIDAGLTWVKQITQETNPLYSVYFTSNDSGYAVGGNGMNSGTVLKTIDGGNNWTLATSQTSTFYSVFFPYPNTGYAVGTNGTIIKYSDTATNSISINNFASHNTFSIFSNPFSDHLHIVYAVAEEWPVTISIYTMMGQKISELVSTNHHLPGKHTAIFDARKLSAGVYYIRIVVDEKSENIKVIKVR